MANTAPDKTENGAKRANASAAAVETTAKPAVTGRLRYRGLAIWAVALSDIFIVCGIPLFFYNLYMALVIEAVAVVCFILSVVQLFTAKRRMQQAFYQLAMNNDSVQSHVISQMQIPYAVVNQDGDIIWQNEAFGVFARERKKLGEIIPGFGKQEMRKAHSREGIDLQLGNSYYRVVSENLRELEESGDLVKEFMGEDVLWGLTFYDETALISMKKELADQKNMVCLLYLDNYDEALENVEQVRQSILIALIERKISRYFLQYDALLRKLEKDKYLAVIKQKHLETLKETRFSILEEVKDVNIGNAQAVTVSIGLGMGGDEYAKNYEYARVAIDMALARGGDQAVVKDASRIQYFGGRSQQVEKNTRVKARMKAHALAELVRPHEQIFIMGHRLGDIDCVGAGIGMYRAMATMGKKTHIVMNDVIASVKPFYDYFTQSADYPNDLFVTGEQAMQMINDDTVLIIVDTNRRSIVEQKELVDRAKNIVVLDHHRQVSDYIADATLSYVEPFASSASEMVAEILQYFGDGEVPLRPTEADAIYAGIVLDTHNFTAQTGVRTFEAAAYLRKNGADITKVRKLFRDDLEAYKVKAEAIHNMEIIFDRFAITVCPPYGESPTVLAAETANDLLSISEIQGSFVLTEYEGTVFISARSIDEVNVQLIMEKLGGGGHMSIAGAQLKGAQISEAKELMKETIGQMIEEGEI